MEPLWPCAGGAAYEAILECWEALPGSGLVPGVPLPGAGLEGKDVLPFLPFWPGVALLQGLDQEPDPTLAVRGSPSGSASFLAASPCLLSSE